MTNGNRLAMSSGSLETAVMLALSFNHAISSGRPCGHWPCKAFSPHLRYRTTQEAPF